MDNKPIFYTDASYKKFLVSGKIRATICISKIDGMGTVHYFEEIDESDILSAELTAILRCLENNLANIKIYSDSAAAVALINSRKRHRTSRQRYHQVAERIKDLDREFELIWIPRKINLAGHAISQLQQMNLKGVI